MSDRSDIERFVNDPGLLIKLCHDVIDRIKSGPDDLNEAVKEAQLREIARSIERLEKMNIPVPDTLRAEKTRLAADMGNLSNVTQTLRQLADEFDRIIIKIKARSVVENGSVLPKKNRVHSPRSSSPKTSQRFYRDYIISALRKFGGRGRVADVLNEMERHLNGQLQPGDFELRKDGKTVGWRNTAQWERLVMVKEGILRSDSPDGIWELAEGHR